MARSLRIIHYKVAFGTERPPRFLHHEKDYTTLISRKRGPQVERTMEDAFVVGRETVSQLLLLRVLHWVHGVFVWYNSRVPTSSMLEVLG